MERQSGVRLECPVAIVDSPTSHLKTLLAGTSLALRRGAFQGHAKASSGDQETDLHVQRKYFSSMFVFVMDYKYIHGQEDYYMSMGFPMSSIYNAMHRCAPKNVTKMKRWRLYKLFVL